MSWRRSSCSARRGRLLEPGFEPWRRSRELRRIDPHMRLSEQPIDDHLPARRRRARRGRRERWQFLQPQVNLVGRQFPLPRHSGAGVAEQRNHMVRPDRPHLEFLGPMGLEKLGGARRRTMVRSDGQSKLCDPRDRRRRSRSACTGRRLVGPRRRRAEPAGADRFQSPQPARGARLIDDRAGVDFVGELPQADFLLVVERDLARDDVVNEMLGAGRNAVRSGADDHRVSAGFDPPRLEAGSALRIDRRFRRRFRRRRAFSGGCDRFRFGSKRNRKPVASHLVAGAIVGRPDHIDLILKRRQRLEHVENERPAATDIDRRLGRRLDRSGRSRRGAGAGPRPVGRGAGRRRPKTAGSRRAFHRAAGCRCCREQVCIWTS